MWRAFFIAVGISLCIGGAECLVLDRAILKREETVASEQSSTSSLLLGTEAPRSKNAEWIPKDWHPWSLMSVGAVVILYAYSFGKKAEG